MQTHGHQHRCEGGPTTSDPALPCTHTHTHTRTHMHTHPLAGISHSTACMLQAHVHVALAIGQMEIALVIQSYRSWSAQSTIHSKDPVIRSHKKQVDPLLPPSLPSWSLSLPLTHSLSLPSPSLPPSFSLHLLSHSHSLLPSSLSLPYLTLVLSPLSLLPSTHHPMCSPGKYS